MSRADHLTRVGVLSEGPSRGDEKSNGTIDRDTEVKIGR